MWCVCVFFCYCSHKSAVTESLIQFYTSKLIRCVSHRSERKCLAFAFEVVEYSMVADTSLIETELVECGNWNTIDTRLVISNEKLDIVPTAMWQTHYVWHPCDALKTISQSILCKIFLGRPICSHEIAIKATRQECAAIRMCERMNGNGNVAKKENPFFLFK